MFYFAEFTNFQLPTNFQCRWRRVMNWNLQHIKYLKERLNVVAECDDQDDWDVVWLNASSVNIIL